MSGNHQFGSPKTVLNLNNDNKVVVDFEELDRIFSHADIQDRKVVILSMIGAFRGGKSFFLNYCLRFLYANFSSINNPSKETQFIFEVNNNWMGEPDEPLTGFSWRAGSKRDTTGILFWSDVFLHTIDRTGEKIAIFVMDTQGLFDNDSTQADNSRIFTLATLMSSTLVLNVSNRIQVDQLQYLQFIAEFSKNAAVMDAQKDNVKPFQKLIFLVRDWSEVDEDGSGPKGGLEYLKQVLTVKNPQNLEIQSVRKTIKDAFEHINCYLLPHPGKHVARPKAYDGRLSDMDDIFKSELKKAIEDILMPSNLPIKKIMSKVVTVGEMRSFNINFLMDCLQDKLSDPADIFHFTLYSCYSNLYNKCVDYYITSMYRNKDLLVGTQMIQKHSECRREALKMFKPDKYMKNDDLQKEFEGKLQLQIDYIFKYYRTHVGTEHKFEDEYKRQDNKLEKEKKQKLEEEATRKAIEDKIRKHKKDIEVLNSRLHHTQDKPSYLEYCMEYLTRIPQVKTIFDGFNPNNYQNPALNESDENNDPERSGDNRCPVM
ncbi:atlastin-like [Chironomus tepperi]|uniref:atlastin-like n=1 Tax=Chironomus tepperi TaxID=113505 RepID=UPI00391FB9BE